jgi:small subunit ribosomal protein S2
VATQPAFEDLALETAKELGIPVVTKRWLGGTLTNYKMISKRIEYFKKLKTDMASGAFEKYTKKERLEIERDIERLREFIGGIETMTRLPDVLVVIDPNLHATAVHEARQLHIPVIAYTNVDSNPDVIDYPVLGNNKGRQSVNWFLSKIKQVIIDAKNIKPAPAQPVQAQ